ncbi:cytochrome P450 [Boletus reticuloceps]|uniref:Cytochrome P450 n=1 Tax=Boletus reticuloceps TaxID=495285 RepID=A0A8I2YP88_9AGAM|nr:cytochrome P450 [Boletus reticuloceps]
MSLSPTLSTLIALWGVVTIYIVGSRRLRTQYSLPPGPKPLPLIGNLLDIPLKNEATTYNAWAKKYGDLVYATVMGHRLLFVNSSHIANELFEKRFSNYSDRNKLPMINDLMGWDWSFGHMPYGERWRKHRKMFERQFRPVEAQTFWPLQKKEAHTLLRNILDSQEDLIEHLRHNSAAVIMNVIYGIEISPKADRYIEIAEKALEGMAKAAAPGAFLVDVFPWLKYVPRWAPGAGFQKKAANWKKYVLEMRDAPFVAVRKALVAGTASPCFVTHLMSDLDNTDDAQEQVEVIRGCAGLAYAAGAESTVSSLSSFFLAMVLYPAAQAQAQAELDSVIGSGRLPDYNDRQSLPYINAIVKEVLRWNPVAPLGLPHMVTKDDSYDGYFIPAGTTIIGNTWTILHDERNYIQPMEFLPERFLNPDGNTENQEILDPATAAFGYGRRICPGRFMADATLWISIACILTVFDIRPGKDENGDPVAVKADFESGMICHPKSFSYAISPRSEAAKAIIKETAILS